MREHNDDILFPVALIVLIISLMVQVNDFITSGSIVSQFFIIILSICLFALLYVHLGGGN